MRPPARWNLTLAALLAAAWTATHSHAQVLPAPKPAPALAPSAVAKPLNPAGTRAATGPGTQTEDDVYVGSKRTAQRPVQGVTAPTTGTPAPRPGAGTSPNTGALAKKNARAGGDDLDDLQPERRTVQRDGSPLTATPQPRSGAGTSPNTGRSAAPAGLPYKH